MTKEYLKLYLAEVEKIKSQAAAPDIKTLGLIRLRGDIVNMALSRELESPAETRGYCGGQ